MKILIYSSGKIPSQRAHSINIIKHAQAFHDLNHKVEVYSTTRLFEDIFKFKYKNINNFYDITSQVKIEFIKDRTLFYFKDIIPYFFKRLEKQTKKFEDSPSKEVNVDEKLRNETSKLIYIFQKIRNNFYDINFFNIEKRISTYCKKNLIELCYTRDCRILYYNNYNKIPTILECHDSNLWKPNMQYLLRSNKSKYFKCLVTISDNLKDIYIRAGIPKEKILVIEDAVELKNYDKIKKSRLELRGLLKLPKEKKIILYTGSLFEGRGIDTIIDAANILNDENLIFYIIGGNNKERRRWQMYKAKKNNQINVKFIGFIQNSKIPLYHKAADILVAPYSLKCNNIDWMSPIKLFEYMASKVPIIASNVKRIKQICNKGECIFFKESSPFDLAEKIKILINDKDLGSIISEKAFQTVTNYSYEKRCQRIIKFFKET